MSIVVTILICTRDRSASLARTLDSIAQTTVPDQIPSELLIIDNGSQDDTERVVRNASERVPLPIRYLVEPRPGKSRAYNRGLAAANGNIFISTDDDVRVPSNWIEKMALPILRNEADLIQGGVVAADHLQRPWLVRSFLAISATLLLKKPTDEPSHCVGANFAFSRAVLDKVKGFDPMLGPGSLSGLGEDTLFGYMAKEAGFKARYADDCSVVHHFDPSRLEPANAISVARKLGRTFAFIDYHWHHDDSKTSRAKLRFLRLKLALRPPFSAWWRDHIPEWRFCYERDAAYQQQMVELNQTNRRYHLRASAACVT